MIPDWSWSCQEWSRSRPHSYLDLCTDSDTAEHQRQGSGCPGCWCCSRRRSPCNMTSNCDKIQWWRWKTRILFPSCWSWTVLLSVVQFCYLEFFSNTLKTTLLDRGGYFYQHVNALACTKIIILLSSFEGKKKEIEEIRKQFSQKYLFCLLMM